MAVDVAEVGVDVVVDVLVTSVVSDEPEIDGLVSVGLMAGGLVTDGLVTDGLGADELGEELVVHFGVVVVLVVLGVTAALQAFETTSQA